MKRILCPTDFSMTANNAIAYAAKFAQVTGSELILFNVQSFFELSPAELIKGESEHVEIAKSTLQTQAHEVSREFNVSCYADMQVSGMALSTLINNVGSDFDLIIMGTNGPDDMYQFFTGSNTYNVIRKASLPVLLVPDNVDFSQIELAILAYDYLRDGMPPIELVHQILKPFDCELRVLQLLEESFSQLQESELQGKQQLITNILSKDVRITFDSIHTDSLVRALNSYMKRNEGDLLILSSKHYSTIKRLFHKSLTKALSVIADFPLLVLH